MSDHASTPAALLSEESGLPFPLKLNKFENFAPTAEQMYKELSLIFVCQGAVRVRVEEEDLIVYAGQCLFINQNRTYTLFPDYSHPVQFLQILFSSKLISQFPGSSIEHKYAFPVLRSDVVHYHLFHSQQTHLADCIRQIKQAMDNEQWGYEITALSHLLEIWHILLLQIQEDISLQGTWSKEERTRCKIILAYIEQNYAQRITLQDLADIIHISKEEFCRFFKRAMICTPIEYLNNFRLNKSLELLMNTDYPIVRIAMDVGFSNASYYAEQFKRFTGHTPTEFRKRAKKKA